MDLARRVLSSPQVSVLEARGGTADRCALRRSRTYVPMAPAGRASTLSSRWLGDLRHTAITNDAAAGASPIAVMAKAGHANMRTTQTYLHLAGVVFRNEVERLERRLLSAEPSTHSSTRLSEPEPTSDDLIRVGKPETAA
jgi:hypothetical protein